MVGENKNIVGRGGEIFQEGGMTKFSTGGGDFPHPPVGKNMY